eukprot:TRINITY_DN1264_c0_g1_i2.p1 TRINITY_DN1264_c0_g1~~TRINITY_DN1264_c0_g1_i2.p1  ORF type:complete len:79 (-),score=15.50 TRINITY_DN1264_c0_g1_i2:19-255(-)
MEDTMETEQEQAKWPFEIEDLKNVPCYSDRVNDELLERKEAIAWLRNHLQESRQGTTMNSKSSKSYKNVIVLKYLQIH